ncbi:uncharacterized protein [Neodiprion pinetum]|uniref:uncharacterized protein n=1 Tax=Neodiprion pinetum TaxID=441929 RepID=UPI003712A256
MKITDGIATVTSPRSESKVPTTQAMDHTTTMRIEAEEGDVTSTVDNGTEVTTKEYADNASFVATPAITGLILSLCFLFMSFYTQRYYKLNIPKYTKFVEPTRPEVTTAELDWWQTAVIYQIYPKSFQDSDGDGIGDLQGIISRLDYLEDTGFTGFSLTPIYPSPQVDGGYDVSNFTGIDPIFGQFEDFQELVNTAHQKNLKVILDFVPNHSSNEHIWFQNSVARVEPYTDYYVWKDGVSSGNVVQPPNNWLSVFGGSAWTWNEQRQQYYLHQFHESQPDLNLRNSAVVTEITDVLRFWLDQDVDGFRISSVAHLFEDASFLDEPLNEEASSGVTETDYEYLRHIYTTDLDETIDIIYQWRAVVDEYSTRPDSETKILVTDSTARQNVITRYFGNQTHEGAHIPLNFGFISNLRRESTAYDFVEMAEEWFSALPHGRTSNSIFGNHDVSRIASRFFLNRVDSLNMQLLLSPGTAFTYQGEELGLLDTLILYEETEDPGAIAAGPNRFELFTRDPARTPFHWDGSTSAGFSLNSSTWLPVNPNYLVRNVAIQSAATRSMYQTYKALLDIRQSETIKRGSITFKSANDGMVLAIVRELEGYESYAILANFGVHFANVNLTALTNFPTENVTICLASANSLVETGTTINVNSVVLTASAAVVLCNKVADVTEPETTTPITDTEAVILDDWFTTASIYQIYPKSFQDSNDDGVGDLQGIISRLDHLRETGITAIWLNSIATSPQIDGGYDITNFTDIDPIFGNLEDFAELVRQAHARELKIIIDFVPNHSSNEHVWFQNSIARIEPYTDYYIWKDGIVSDNRLQPPNNWLSVFGDSAWTWSEQRQQYYLHQFHTSQPDLNFRNPDVVTEMTNVLKFWLDQEVDGFRICSVAHLFEDEDFFDEPRNANPDPYILETDYDYLEHIYTTDRDETVDIVYQWRTVVDEHAEQSDGQARILITDSSANQNVVSRYFGNQTHQGAHVPLNFAMITNLTRLSSASSYINAFNEWFAILPENRTSNWILGNHDNTRIASKFGLNRADGLNMLLLLRGTTFTYMGEELALLDTEVSFNDTQDPHAINAGPDRFQLFTRDPARTPYQWDNTSLAGFSTSNSSWLPVNDNYVFRNLAVQKTAERSNYHTYQAILQLRQRECIKYGTTQFLSLNSDMVLAFTREILSGERYAVIINLGLGQLIVDLSNLETFVNEDVYVFLASANSVINTGSTVNISAVPLSANAALVLSTRQIEDTTQQLSTLDTITTPSITSTETVTETATSTPIFPTIPDRPILVSGEITGNLDWWQEAAVYQIYPKSFQDSNGDGVGDLQGIISRLEHLSDTGVTAIWLNSLLASPQVDGGFDISNFTAVDPIFGTLDDFAELIQEAHNKEIRVIIDFVPNHSSNEHVWFQNSVARIEPYTDYYVWRDGITLDNGIQPPNNWLSVFGGSAWSWNEQRQQYYLHQFDTSQADLNFRNPAVVSEITNVLRFWLDQGVDGFRVSSVAHIFEDVHFPDEPLNESPGPNVLETDYEYLQHIYTTDLDETIDIVYQWRTLLDEYTAQLDVQTRVLVTDSAASQDVVARYFGNQTHQGAHLPLNFGLIAKLGQPSLASDYIQVLTSWFATLPENGTSNWILGNHDERRPASRFGTNRVDGLNMLHLLPGTAFTYMGEELALLDTEISFADTQDPYAINAGPDRYSLFTRDPARTPYHWDNSTSGGFSTNESTWLPMNSNYVTRNLIAQIAAERSNFNTYKSILKLKQSQTIKRGATHIWALNNNSVLVFIRQLQDEPVYAVAINLGLVTVSVNFSQFSGLPSEGMRVCLASANAVISTGTIVNIMSVSLSANAAVVLCNSEVPETTTVSITTTTVADMPSTTVELSTETPTTSPTPVHTESEPPTTIPPLITTPSTSTTTTFSTTMNAFSTTLIPSPETSTTSTTLIISTTANTTTVPSTTVESSTKTPTILPTMATDKPEPETEPDYSEENTTEDSASAAVTTYISSLLIIVPIWNISL